MKSKRRRRNDVVLNCCSVWKLQSCFVFLRVERRPNLVLVLPHYCNVSNLGPSKWRGSDGPDPGWENSESDSTGDSSESRTDSAAAEWQRRSWTDVYGRELAIDHSNTSFLILTEHRPVEVSFDWKSKQRLPPHLFGSISSHCSLFSLLKFSQQSWGRVGDSRAWLRIIIRS